MENESKIRKVLFNEVSFAIAGIGLVSSIIFWVLNPQQNLQLEIVKLQGQVLNLNPQRLGFAYATTSWTGTSTIYMGPAYRASTVNYAYCETDTGTVGVSLYDGTNRANYIPTASTTINKYAYSSNNTFTAGESMRVDIGTPASTPTRLSCSFGFTVTD